MATVDMTRALAVKARHEAEWLRLPGVTGVDVGTIASGPSQDVAAIRIYVADQAQGPSLPTEVEGVPIVVIAKRFQLQ